MKFEVYNDSSGKPRWRLKAGNGQTIASSGESFSSHANAVAAAENFKSKSKSWNYEVYADAADKHRWRAKAANGQNVGSMRRSFRQQVECSTCSRQRQGQLQLGYSPRRRARMEAQTSARGSWAHGVARQEAREPLPR